MLFCQLPTWNLSLIPSPLYGGHQHALLLQVHIRRQLRHLAVAAKCCWVLPWTRLLLLLELLLLHGGSRLELSHHAKALACSKRLKWCQQGRGGGSQQKDEHS